MVIAGSGVLVVVGSVRNRVIPPSAIAGRNQFRIEPMHLEADHGLTKVRDGD
jgi:hypothetical protein